MITNSSAFLKCLICTGYRIWKFEMWESDVSCILLTSGLSESSESPPENEDFVELVEDQHPPTTTTMRSFYGTNRINTHASNELLFVVLGVVLGIMMLILCVVMVMCACKQQQQRRDMGECLINAFGNIFSCELITWKSARVKISEDFSSKLKALCSGIDMLW